MSKPSLSHWLSRSSGLFEDSLNQPFAGIFETYLIPNIHPDPKVRLEQLMNAIKLVYASVYSKTAKGYIEAINYKIEQEKMAVVIQEVVGNHYEDVFYPHISGVAQSYNYYPFAHMKPEEGLQWQHLDWDDMLWKVNVPSVLHPNIRVLK